MSASADDGEGRSRLVVEVCAVFLRLGLTAFGGPIAHLGYFREAFVVQRRWLDERTFADLVALCQFLPGPASSQVGIGVGFLRAGLAGALAAWLAFTLPSALAMTLAGFGVLNYAESVPEGALHGLKIVAVAVVAQAVLGMARSACADVRRAVIAVLSAIAVVAWPTAPMQLGVIAAGGVAGAIVAQTTGSDDGHALGVRLSRGAAAACLAAFALLLLALPVARGTFDSQTLGLVDTFYRAGALVFGGGHVVLPLLQVEVVPSGWVSKDDFMAGYGAAQALPGPLFTFAAYLGTVASVGPGGAVGAMVCLAAIFAPAALLVLGTLPFWLVLRRRTGVRRALLGINAAVVGILLGALYDPVWTSAIGRPRDLVVAAIAFALLVVARAPPWLVVLLCAAAGAFWL